MNPEQKNTRKMLSKSFINDVAENFVYFPSFAIILNLKTRSNLTNIVWEKILQLLINLNASQSSGILGGDKCYSSLN